MTTGERAEGASPHTGAVAEVARFLHCHAPFEGLGETELERVAASVVVRRVRAGESVLVEGGPPSTQLFIVRQGVMDLVAEGTLVDILTSGQAFGAPSLLTGLAPKVTVRAREDSTLYLVPSAVATDLLTRPKGLAFLVASLSDQLAKTAQVAAAARDPRTVPVSSLVRRPPVFCAPETPIREAARIMSEEVVTAVLVESHGELGIVTDADLRDKVLASGSPSEAPIAAIMTAPVLTISAERLAPEASIEMMQAGVNHLVVVDADGGVVGIVSAGSLMAPDALSPFALRWSIAAARSEEKVVEVAARLPQVFVSLLDARLDAFAVSRLLTLVSDSLTRRLLELAELELGQPPVAYCWLALGGAARSELSLASDQDNALAYADADDPSVGAYFERLAIAVNDGLERCGFAQDESGVLARDDRWRMSQSDWARVFTDCFDVEDWEHTVRAFIAFDLRLVHGNLDMVTPLRKITLEVPRHPTMLNRLARTIIDAPLPLGFRHRLPHAIDVKRDALRPVENVARYYALASRVGASSTLDRLVALERLGALTAESAAALRGSFRAMTELRLRHHAEAIRAGRSPSDTLETAALDPLTRASVVEALRIIAGVRRHVPRYYLAWRDAARGFDGCD